jgi:Rieske Fe-S protein
VAEQGDPQAVTDAEAGASNGVTRKQFLTGATLAVGGVMGALIVVPVAGMALSPAVANPKFKRIKLGSVDDFPEGTYKPVVIEPDADDYDGYIKKRLIFIRKNASPDDDALAQKGQWQYTVISNRCAHLGCPVQESGGKFVCPCHGGQYNDDGKRIAGPPVRPLDRFEWEIDGNDLYAVDEFSINQDGKRVSKRDPGQHSGGLESLLYPLQPSQL